MKNFGTIIVVFLFLVVAIVGIVVAVKFFEDQQAAQAEARYQQMVGKYRQQSGNTTTVPTPTPTPSQVTAASLTTDLQGALDDGGQSDFDQLQKDLSSL